MTCISIVVTAYNCAEHITECLDSLVNQTYRDIEIVVSDDKSTDNTAEVVRNYQKRDRRIVYVRNEHNSGCVVTRKNGALHSTGDYVMFIDPDDTLHERTCEYLAREAEQSPADILHFGVKVEAANEMAKKAAKGMESVTNPRPRSLFGPDILAVAFTDNGYDWNVCHKLFRGRFVRRYFADVPNVRLIQSEDTCIYFILAANAGSYRAIANSSWYIYHLGRGVTLSETRSVASYESLCRQSALSLTTLSDYVHSKMFPYAIRQSLQQLRFRLIQHAMNDWNDNVSLQNKEAALHVALHYWKPEEVGAELYRFLRDCAYRLAQSDSIDKRSEQWRNFVYLREAVAEVESVVIGGRITARYALMKGEAQRDVALVDKKIVGASSTESDYALRPLWDAGSGMPEPVPVVFAADDGYVPQLTTAIYSAMMNASKNRFYDVVVLQRNIAWNKQEQLRDFFRLFPNMTLRFTNADHMMNGCRLSTNNEHVSVETYYRFLIQEVLPFYDKVLYLDSDIVVTGDIAELYDTDLGDNMLAAVRDIDFLGNLNIKDGKRLRYAINTLKMRNPYDYFQAGVLVLNIQAMRKRYSIQHWLDYASASQYIYNDQDVLNMQCEGKVKFLSWDWNVIHDLENRVSSIFSQAPDECFDGYMASRQHPLIIHYAGCVKPWTDPDCDFASVYWSYAREMPFYESLLKCVVEVGESSRNTQKRLPPRAISEHSGLRKVIDPIAPLGSPQREIVKRIGRKIRGK